VVRLDAPYKVSALRPLFAGRSLRLQPIDFENLTTMTSVGKTTTLTVTMKASRSTYWTESSIEALRELRPSAPSLTRI
jgi:hypothetical protein